MKVRIFRIALLMAALAGTGPASLMGTDDAAEPPDLFGTFRWRSIGPANMMGRVSALDALDEDYRTVLVGSASGGVFKSTNAGVTWTPIFDRYGSGSIGDVAFFQGDPDIIWVGTGEANNRNSSGWGDGIYRSDNGGKTFTNMGLRETHQIARIATHPTDPGIVYVAAVGHLWGVSGTRGLFKTGDGGKTWEKLSSGLPDNPRTGCTEIKMHPTDPETLYCAMYHRLRRPWTFHSGSPDGGMFKSTDGGRSWNKLTKGLPQGDLGRIGIDIYRSDPSILVASVEASDRIPEDMNRPGPGVYRSEDGGETWRYRARHTSRPMYHGRIAINPLDDNLIYVIARIFLFSDDGGRTFKGKPWRGAGGDDHDLWLSPRDKNVFYTATDQGAHLTLDGGKSFLSFNNMAIAQYYAIGVDMRDPYWVYGGMQDIGGFGTPSNSRDRMGILNDHSIEINGGDGFHMQIDPTDWRTVYAVCHVGGLGRIDMKTREGKLISPRPETILNFAAILDPHYPESPIRYSIFPGEHWLWNNPSRSRYSSLLPPQFRYNWSSPLILSPHNPRTLLFGGNHLFKSVDRGDHWRIISPDLTTNDPDKRNSSESGGLTHEVTGAENHCTIISISESPVKAGIIWVGTDDGNVQVTKNDGGAWFNARPNIPGVPKGIWCSRVEASHHAEGTAYATFDGHRSDLFTPWIFKTEDFGESWESLSGDLPDGHSLYVVREDPVNPGLLFAGSEFACFATADGGETWHRFMKGLPTVAVHDLIIHSRDADLVAGTHGRSLYITDDISPLQQLSDEVLDKEIHLFQPRRATRWQDVSLGRQQSFFKFRGRNPRPGAAISYYLKNAAADRVRITVENASGDRARVLNGRGRAGINQVRWDLTFPPTARETAAFRDRLAEILRELSGLVTAVGDRETVSRLREQLNGAEGPRVFNRIHRELTRRLGTFSEGRDLYGESLSDAAAPAGTYRIILEAGGDKTVGRLKLREDPLLDGQKTP